VVFLDDVVRDELILETPIFPLCSEDCPGMSAVAEARDEPGNQAVQGGGTEASIDPRLLPLLRLRTKRD
jgi:uncharacterized protein